MRIVVPPVVNYGMLYQRPQQLMRILAQEGHEIYFYNAEPGWKGQFECGKKIQEVEPNFFVVPMSFHPKDFHPDIYYFTYPEMYDWIDKMKPKRVIFDCVDAPVEEFISWGRNWTKCVTEADLVLAVSTKLHQLVSKFRGDVKYSLNGCDYEMFQVKTQNPYPWDNPTIGFSGAIASWVDIDLIYESCKAYPNFEFVIFGLEFNVGLDKNKMPENLHFLGHKPYLSLPMWINNLDVCTVPFKDTQVSQGSNPIKFWEYMASGNPTVTTNLAETKYPCTLWATSPEEYVEFIGVGVEEKLSGNNYSDKRKEFASKNTWKDRAKPILDFMGEM